MAGAKLKYVHCNTCGNWHYDKYAAALQNAGAEVEVVELRYSPRLDVISGIYDRAVPCRRFGLDHAIRSPIRPLRELERICLRMQSIAARCRLQRYLADPQITHYVAADPLALQFCVRAKARTHAKVSYVPIEPYRHCISLGQKLRPEFVRLESRYFPRIDCAVFMGNSILADYAAAYGGAERFRVVHNSWPLAIQAQRKDLRRAAGLKADQIIILYTGSVSVHRGVLDVVAAMTQLPASACFVAMGFGPDMGEVKKRAAALGISDRVIVLPAVPQKDLMDFVGDADIGIIPFRGDYSHTLALGCPTKMFEFIAAGLPLVVSGFPDTKEVVTTHHLGEAFTPHDTADLARALRLLLQSPDYRRQCAENSRKCHHDMFCWERQSKILSDIILG